ncbi:MAG: hypothetical protein DCC67_08165 [Planctomycetota bacterium]|nr:MAG: hypothetical protein DCC67_08165 [Planctomycetota bacterium]
MGLAAALAPGCAGLRVPRIDPSGERCFIWPEGGCLGRSPTAAAPALTPPTSPLAPPVGTDPYFPAPPPGAAPVAATLASASAPAGAPTQDAIAITPARVLAPVGSEVVLKASICTPEGYSLADQQVQWMLGRNGVGEIVEVGGKGVFHPPLLPWNGGAKVDSYLAHGYTANGPLCITRGTPDPADDIDVNRGDAWISISSPNEGTSHVTALAPTVASWDHRKAAATIYWVDVQWQFPPAAVTSSGQGETLTTLVTRQSDGSPLAGWIVRYEVADAGGSSSGVSEIVTGADGRASAKVSPTAAGAASSQIDVQLIRPAGLGGGDAPRLIVARSTTTVHWSGGDPYLPPAASPPTAPAPIPAPGPSLPASPPAQPTPQPQLPAGQPRLELSVTGQQQAVVGGTAAIRVAIRNLGDGPATNVVVSDAFDPALVFPARPNSDKIERLVGTIAPGAAFDEELVFQVNKAGRLCHQVTASSAEAAAVEQQFCLDATEPPPQREARLEVRLDGERQRVAGETATFIVTVKNAGQTALVNIETVEEYLPASVLQPIPQRGVEVVSNTITRRIARLDVGQQQQFETQVLCLRPAATVGPIVRARAQTDPPTHVLQSNDDHFLEIVARQSPAAPPAQQPPAASGPLRIAVNVLPAPTRVGASATCEVTVSNRSAQTEEQVSVRVVFPPELSINATGIQGPPNVGVQIDGNTVTFGPLATVRPTEVIRYVIPINPKQAGVVTVTAGAISRGLPQGVSDARQVEILSSSL